MKQKLFGLNIYPILESISFFRFVKLLSIKKALHNRDEGLFSRGGRIRTCDLLLPKQAR